MQWIQTKAIKIIPVEGEIHALANINDAGDYLG
jgi:hypothetical protein